VNTKSVMGIGSIVVVIAMIIVAAVGASILISTTGILQQKSVITGQAARKKITNNFLIDFIHGISNDDRLISDMEMRISLTPGSDPAMLNTTAITETTQSSVGAYSYKKHAECLHDAINGYYNFNPDPAIALYEPFLNPISKSFGMSSKETSEFLIGKIVVSVAFVESSGSFDTESEEWARGRQNSVINSLSEAFNWYREREPRAGIEFAYDVNYNARTGYEPITRDLTMANQELWVDEVLDELGAPSGSDVIERSRRYVDNLRQEYNAHWGFILFVVDNTNDADGFFPGSLPWGVAYNQGPYAIVPSGRSNFSSILSEFYAHEIGHIFGAGDQYPASNCNCTDRYGYLKVENQNCDNPSQGSCTSNTSSIMKSISGGVAFQGDEIDPYARAQLGWSDVNHNDILDATEVVLTGSNLPSDRQILSWINSYEEYTEHHTRFGFFSASHLIPEKDLREDILSPGHSMVVCFEPSKSIEASDIIDLTVTPIKGSKATADVKVPNVVPKDGLIVLYEAYK